MMNEEKPPDDEKTEEIPTLPGHTESETILAIRNSINLATGLVAFISVARELLCLIILFYILSALVHHEGLLTITSPTVECDHE